MYVFVLTWDPLSVFLLTAAMGNSSDLFIGETYSGDFSSTPVQVWKLILNGRVCSVELCCEPLKTFRKLHLTCHFPLNQRRQQQAQSLGRLIKQLSCHSDCLPNLVEEWL